MKKLGIRENNLHLRREEINDSECGEFYGFRIDAEQRKSQEDLQKEIEGGEYTISTYGEDTEEWEEANRNLEEKKQELSRQIELSLWLGGLREILNNFEEDKIWNANKETSRMEASKVNYIQFKKKKL